MQPLRKADYLRRIEDAFCDVPVPAGSIIQFYLSSSVGQNVAIRNVRLRFDIVESNRPALTLTN